MRCLGHALMRLHARELCEAAPVGFVAPDFERRIVHRIVAVLDRRRIAIPDAAMNHHAVADLDVVHVVPGRIDDSRRVAAADMKIRMIVLGLLPRADHVHRRAERRPHVVEIDARRHHVNQHFVGADFRHRDFLDLERMLGVAEPVRANHLRVHLLRHLPDGRHVADLVDFLMAHFILFVGYHRARCGWLQLWYEAAPMRAGISYLFAASLTILTCRALGKWLILSTDQ